MIVSAVEDGVLCVAERASHAAGGLDRSECGQEQCQTDQRGNWGAPFAGLGLGAVSESMSG
jgi:hypothetical protein